MKLLRSVVVVCVLAIQGCGASSDEVTCQAMGWTFGILGDIACLAAMKEKYDAERAGAAAPPSETVETAGIQPETLDADALKQLCEAANEGQGKAQRKLALMHRSWNTYTDNTIVADNRVAYMWYTLAAVNGEDTVDSRSITAEDMTDEELTEAQEMARSWRPGQCPRP